MEYRGVAETDEGKRHIATNARRLRDLGESNGLWGERRGGVNSTPFRVTL